jgi:hypothetical protein
VGSQYLNIIVKKHACWEFQSNYKRILSIELRRYKGKHFLHCWKNKKEMLNVDTYTAAIILW